MKPLAIVETEEESRELGRLGIDSCTMLGVLEMLAVPAKKEMVGFPALVLPDNDAFGADFAQAAAVSLRSMYFSVRIKSLYVGLENYGKGPLDFVAEHVTVHPRILAQEILA